MASVEALGKTARGSALLLLWSAVAIVLVAKAAVAVTITPAQPGATTLYDASESYVVGDQGGTTTLFRLSVTLAPRGGSAGFVNTLATAFGAGWSFAAAVADLTGSFNIDVYDAVGTPTRVGANFDMTYVVGLNDIVNFTDAGRTFHWIQRVVDNHALGGGHGVAEDTIDTSAFTVPPDVNVPFYDVFSAAEIAAGNVFATAPPRFQDGPFRSDADRDHQWKAEVYLVEELAAAGGRRQVLIYNGVNWGWTNVVPEPAALVVLLTGLGLLALMRWRTAY